MLLRVLRVLNPTLTSFIGFIGQPVSPPLSRSILKHNGGDRASRRCAWPPRHLAAHEPPPRGTSAARRVPR